MKCIHTSLTIRIRLLCMEYVFESDFPWSCCIFMFHPGSKSPWCHYEVLIDFILLLKMKYELISYFQPPRMKRIIISHCSKQLVDTLKMNNVVKNTVQSVLTQHEHHQLLCDWHNIHNITGHMKLKKTPPYSPFQQDTSGKQSPISRRQNAIGNEWFTWSMNCFHTSGALAVFVDFILLGYGSMKWFRTFVRAKY